MSPSLSPTPPYMPAVTEEPEPPVSKQNDGASSADSQELHDLILRETYLGGLE
ncbi:MAG: hypothetical protein M1831_001113 [Alyxoria varia]|nr:MAG: hypothetical protein M1831_001113 [Alyxoria varia]